MLSQNSSNIHTYLWYGMPRDGCRWKAIAILLLLTFQYSLLTIAQPNINRIEYYVDTDPGYGNGISVPYSGTNDISTSFTLNMTSLNEGVHIIGIRSRDANNAWSIDNKWIFLKPYTGGGAPPVPNITRVEYYVDQDPGPGNATNLPISAGQDLSGLAFNIDLLPLTEGVHIVGIRSRDANGAWSIDNKWIFLKPYTFSGGGPIPNINRVEYYIDSDPGLGNGISLPLSPGQNLADLSCTINMAPLSEGVHIIGMRSRDANNAWSIDNKWLFLKKYNNGLAAPARIITQMEYYLDADPGYGKGVQLALLPANNLPNKDIYANITGISVGKHRLYLRSKDDQQAWSIDNIDSFTVAAPLASPVLLINSVAKTSICERDSISVGYDASGSYVAGNTFKVFLSNAAGSFASETEIGSVTSTTDGLIKCQIPQNIPDGAGYKIRLKSSNPVLISDVANFTWSLYDRPHFANDTAVFVVCPTDLFNLDNIYNSAGYLLTWNTASPSVADTGIYKVMAVNGNGCSDTVNVTVTQDISMWTGTTSTNWHVATNWSTGKVPGANTHVIIPAGKPNCIMSASNGAAASVQVMPGAVMQVTNSRVIVISGKCATLPPG